MDEQTFWAKQTPSEPIEPQVLPPTEFALEVPKDVSALAKADTNALIEQARQFDVDNEPSFQLADERQTQLKREAKAIDEKRLEFTRPIDALKAQWMKFFKPAIDSRLEASRVYTAKMTEYRAEQRRIALEAQRKAEAVLREEREKKEAEARKLEEKAAKLKTAAAQEKARREAEERRREAEMIPESVALAATAPQTVASNVAELWRAGITDIGAFLGWIQTRPEWWSIVNFKDAEMNRLAKQCQDVVKVPGVTFTKKDSFRSKGSRF